MSDLYTDIDYDTIMERMLDDVPTGVAKDEGSFTYTMLGPVAAEHMQMYAELNTYYANTFISTMDRTALIAVAEQYGLSPHEASAAVWAVYVDPEGKNLADGTRFNCGDVNLYVSGKTTDGYWEMTCEEEGTVGNDLSDIPVPIDYISGFVSAELVELLTAGVDEETTDEFRERLLEYLQTPAASGNESDYYNWAMSVDGVGAAKVYPLADGAGTVTVVIADSSKTAASDTLVEEVAEYIESVRPIGASVTVKSITESTLDITATVVLVSGYSLDTVAEEFEKLVAEYLADTAFENGYISIAYIGKLLIGLDGVEDYSDLTIGGGTSNITMDDDEIYTSGSVTLTEG